MQQKSKAHAPKTEFVEQMHVDILTICSQRWFGKDLNKLPVKIPKCITKYKGSNKNKNQVQGKKNIHS